MRCYICNMKIQKKAAAQKKAKMVRAIVMDDYEIKDNALYLRTFKIGRQAENARGGLALETFKAVIGGCQVEYDAVYFKTLAELKKWRAKNSADIPAAISEAPDDRRTSCLICWDVHSLTVTDKEGGTVREFESAGDDEGVDWLSEKADKTNANFVLVRTEMQRGLLAESKIFIPRLLAKALITDPYHLRLCMDLDATDIEDDVVGKLGKAFLDSPALKGTGVKKLCDFPDSLTSFVETLAAANSAKYEEGFFDFAIDCEGRYETDSKGEDFCAFDLRGKVLKRISL